MRINEYVPSMIVCWRQHNHKHAHDKRLCLYHCMWWNTRQRFLRCGRTASLLKASTWRRTRTSPYVKGIVEPERDYWKKEERKWIFLS